MDDLFYIDGYYLDEFQIECVKENENILVIAGAGSGKTSTILGKVKYLVFNGIKESDILCISLTNEATNSLRNKLNNINLSIECLTFHKLSLNIIKNYYNKINITKDGTLEYILDEYFKGFVQYTYRKYLLMLLFKSFNYKNILNMDKFKSYKKSIITYINLCKNKNLNIHSIYNLFLQKRNKITYLFILEIYRLYEIEQNSTNSFDFNDMINKASDLVKKNNIKLNYKYIIIDEFQDSSLIKFELINNIIKNNNAKIMCVGDDYQSIYRFAGSELSVFLNFEKYFSNSKIMYLRNTYRNCKELVYISNDFICKNPFQMKKNLLSNKSIDKPIKIIFTTNKKSTLKNLLNKLNYDCMVIGRNNDDIKNYVYKYEEINKINYLTAHKSKGLESNNIILINITNDIMGFPSKIENPNIIKDITNKEQYPLDEERRLFYVAITRTKNNVFILLEKGNISVFAEELMHNYKKYIEYLKI